MRSLWSRTHKRKPSTHLRPVYEHNSPQMGCKKCSPPPAIHPTTGSPMGIARFGVNTAQLLAKKNRGGFPKFSQLSLMTPPSSAPASPSRPRSPRKRAFGPMVSGSLPVPRAAPYTSWCRVASQTHPASPIQGRRRRGTERVIDRHKFHGPTHGRSSEAIWEALKGGPGTYGVHKV